MLERGRVGRGGGEVRCAWAWSYTYSLGGSWCDAGSTALSPDDGFISVSILVLDSVLYRPTVSNTGVGTSVMSI